MESKVRIEVTDSSAKLAPASSAQSELSNFFNSHTLSLNLFVTFLWAKWRFEQSAAVRKSASELSKSSGSHARTLSKLTPRLFQTNQKFASLPHPSQTLACSRACLARSSAAELIDPRCRERVPEARINFDDCYTVTADHREAHRHHSSDQKQSNHFLPPTGSPKGGKEDFEALHTTTQIFVPIAMNNKGSWKRKKAERNGVEKEEIAVRCHQCFLLRQTLCFLGTVGW